MHNPDNIIRFPTPPEPSRGAESEDAYSVEEFIARLHSDDFNPADILAAAHRFMGAARDPDTFGFQYKRPRLLEPAGGRKCFVVRLDLDNAKPPIWRRLRLASDLRLNQLHDVVQIAMGWTDSHLHHFQMGPDNKDFRMQPFLTPFDMQEGETDGISEAEVRLDQVIAKPGQRLFYEYDFGDSWHHTIKLEKVEPWVVGAPVASCVAGRRACPPEDVGGIGGYAELLAALQGEIEPGNEEWMAEMLSWLPDSFDPAAFAVDEVNEMLDQGPFPDLELWHPEVANLLARDASMGPMGLPLLLRRALVEGEELSDDQMEAITLRYRVLLRTIGTGLKLTAAGYLPPKVVQALYEELNLDEEWIGKGNREDQTLPVLTLRESATALGLLRKANGRLNVTAAGKKLSQSPRALLDHIRARIPLGRGFERDAGMLVLLFAAAGQDIWRASDEAAWIAADLGWVVSDGDLGLAFVHSSHPTDDVLNHLCGRITRPETRASAARALLRRSSPHN